MNGENSEREQSIYQYFHFCSVLSIPLALKWLWSNFLLSVKIILSLNSLVLLWYWNPLNFYFLLLQGNRLNYLGSVISVALNVSESIRGCFPSYHQREFGAGTSLDLSLLRTTLSPKSPLITQWPLGLSKTTPHQVGVCKPITVNGALHLISIFCHGQCPNLFALFQRLGPSNIGTKFLFNSIFI